MNARDYLTLADELAGGSRETDWRSSASRAYYAVFHVARELFRQAGFRPPRDGKAHAYLWLRLTNAGHPDIAIAGNRLYDMRQVRTEADYDFQQPFAEETAVDQVHEAIALIRTLDAVAAAPAVLARITQAMRDYERDVLQDVTWHPPPP